MKEPLSSEELREKIKIKIYKEKLKLARQKIITIICNEKKIDMDILFDNIRTNLVNSISEEDVDAVIKILNRNICVNLKTAFCDASRNKYKSMPKEKLIDELIEDIYYGSYGICENENSDVFLDFENMYPDEYLIFMGKEVRKTIIEIYKKFLKEV